MKTRNAIVVLALVLGSAGCKTNNENASLPIIRVIPPTASVNGTGTTQTLGCAFDPGAVEFTELPYNPAENRGSIAAVVENLLTAPSIVNPILRTDSTSFLPHQAVVDYEYIPASAGTAPKENTIPVGGLVVPPAGTATVGVDVFAGLSTPISPPAGTYIRVTMHIEGKLLDGSEVRTAEREYLFRFCNTAGCGMTGPWAAQVGTTYVSCL